LSIKKCSKNKGKSVAQHRKPTTARQQFPQSSARALAGSSVRTLAATAGGGGRTPQRAKNPVEAAPELSRGATFLLLITQSRLQSSRLAVSEIEQMRMMNNTVKQSGGDFGIGENIIPTSEFKVSRNNHRLSFVALGHGLKQQF
jgi:hypothetical protein